MPRSQSLTVFIASTSQDLEEHRAAARLAVLDMQWLPNMMEHASASEHPTLAACRERVEESDLMLLIVAFRRGWVPSAAEGGDGVDSITSFELQHARARGIPVLMLLASDAWPGRLWEDEPGARAWVSRFRATLNQPAIFFEPEPTGAKDAERLPAFRTKVKSVLVDHQRRLLAAEPPAGREPQVDYFDDARASLRDGVAIPFVGSGVFGAGPLGPRALVAELRGAENRRAADGDAISLATASEYVERYLNSRSRFLDVFRAILERQGARAATPPIFTLLGSPRPPALVVSATYDRMLEDTLARYQPVVVSHVLRSYEGRHDGRILVQRPDMPPEMCLADKVDLRGAGCVIYKPLGSPLPVRDLDPDLEIDTVVITETDHLTFLGRLENQHTQVPPVFTRALQRRPLLFLGYDLDVWHYRLVMQVFQSVSRRGKAGPILAVRRSASPMEELAWTRLGASVIAMDTSTFVQRLAAVAAAAAASNGAGAEAGAV
jgi:hypothetical protein